MLLHPPYKPRIEDRDFLLLAAAGPDFGLPQRHQDCVACEVEITAQQPKHFTGPENAVMRRYGGQSSAHGNLADACCNSLGSQQAQRPGLLGLLLAAPRII